MNMNDMRASAYGVTKKSEDDHIQKKAATSTFSSKEYKKVEKPVFKKVDREVGKILETQTTDYLKSGGLIKVPVSQKEADGSDSVYRRVAKFLLLIGVDEAAKILPHLTEEQTERIIPEIASIRSVSPEEASVILEEFNGLLKQSRESSGLETAREILEKAYGPERAAELLQKANPLQGTKPFDYLNDADSERVMILLNDESVQVQALVLSHLEPKKAAAVINLMKPEDKKEVVRRLAKMEPISPEVLRRVDQAMHEKSLAQTTEKAENIDGRSALAEILKKMTPESERAILSGLAEDDPVLGEDLRSRLFTIDDVVNAEDKFIQKELRELSDTEIAMLIAKKPDSFREKILSCISAGRRQMVRDEEEINSPYRTADCQRITAQFFSVLRRAFENGTLIIKGRNEEEYV